MEEKQKSLSQIFNESADEAHDTFRNRLDNLIVLVAGVETPIYVSPEMADHLTESMNEFFNEIITSMRAKSFGAISLDDYRFGDKSLNLIILDPATKFSAHTTRYRPEMYLTYIFDHEMGHLVVRWGISEKQRHLAECAADAFAALRQIQRFDTGESDFFKRYTRAFNAVLGMSPIHYTDSVVQRAKRISEEVDISRLSLSETARLAGEIAERYFLPDETLEKITAAFSPVAAAHRETPKDRPRTYRECIKVMQTLKDDHDIYRAGKQFLDRADIKGFMENEAKTDPFWKGALDWMAQHEKDSGIILDLADAIDAERAAETARAPKPAKKR